MGRHKKVINELKENDTPDPKWKLIYLLCEDYGWHFVQPFGWLVSVGELGITHHKFQKLLNLQDQEYKNYLRKLTKTTLVEKVRFVRQKEAGIKLDWDQLVDDYGKFARHALEEPYSVFNQDPNPSGVVGHPKENAISFTPYIQERPTKNAIAASNYVILKFVGDWTEGEILEFREKVKRIVDEKTGIIEIQRSEFIEETQVENIDQFGSFNFGTDLATRAGNIPRARATTYTKLFYICITK